MRTKRIRRFFDYLERPILNRILLRIPPSKDFSDEPPHSKKKASAQCAEASNSGNRIRTYDLRVMSPTSYQTAPSRTNDTQKIQIAGTGFEPMTFGL